MARVARPGRHFARSRRGRRLLRRAAVSSEPAGARDRDREAQHRRLVAAYRGRRGSDRRHCQRLRRDGQGLWPPAAARRRLCGEGEESLGARARHRRGRRGGMDADRAEGRDGPRVAQGGVSFAVHAAARNEVEGPRRGNPACARTRAHAGARRAPLLRLRGHVFDPAARDFESASKANKLAALESGKPDVIASANIGCMLHLADGATVQVRHWIELLDSRMVGGPRSPA